MFLKIIISIVHILLPTRRPLYRYIKSIASNYKNLDILEIGSGDITLNQSAKHIFYNANSYIQTDINNSYGHQYLDITSEIKIEEKFDTKDAIQNFNFLLKENGHLLVSTPFIYPLHDEPTDYWRFTEHALKELFSDFTILTINTTGIRQFPTQYIFLLQKN
jgi:hypothetical protein